MALLEQRLPENVPGDFFVDSSCIDCDACRQIAPTVFRDRGDSSVVYHQPQTSEEIRSALMALVACPTGSIGTCETHDVRSIVNEFPARISDNVYYCGFNSESSFGAWSYLIQHPEGNFLVDSPRFTAPLVSAIDRMGGIKRMFLTHRDDVADHAKFAARFGCERIMHKADGAVRLAVELVIDGDSSVNLDDDLIAIPTPGHTRGHAVLLYQNKFLFTGDHLSWSPSQATLRASKSTCWYSWAEQTRSMERLLEFEFEWVLPGHGRIHHEAPQVMHKHLVRLMDWMKRH